MRHAYYVGPRRTSSAQCCLFIFPMCGERTTSVVCAALEPPAHPQHLALDAVVAELREREDRVALVREQPTAHAQAGPTSNTVFPIRVREFDIPPSQVRL